MGSEKAVALYAQVTGQRGNSRAWDPGGERAGSSAGEWAQGGTHRELLQKAEGSRAGAFCARQCGHGTVWAQHKAGEESTVGPPWHVHVPPDHSSSQAVGRGGEVGGTAVQPGGHWEWGGAVAWEGVEEAASGLLVMHCGCF